MPTWGIEQELYLYICTCKLKPISHYNYDLDIRGHSRGERTSKSQSYNQIIEGCFILTHGKVHRRNYIGNFDNVLHSNI